MGGSDGVSEADALAECDGTSVLDIVDVSVVVLVVVTVGDADIVPLGVTVGVLVILAVLDEVTLSVPVGLGVVLLVPDDDCDGVTVELGLEDVVGEVLIELVGDMVFDVVRVEVGDSVGLDEPEFVCVIVGVVDGIGVDDGCTITSIRSVTGGLASVSANSTELAVTISVTATTTLWTPIEALAITASGLSTTSRPKSASTEKTPDTFASVMK